MNSKDYDTQIDLKDNHMKSVTTKTSSPAPAVTTSDPDVNHHRPDYVSGIWFVNNKDVEWYYRLEKHEPEQWFLVAKCKEFHPDRDRYHDPRTKQTTYTAKSLAKTEAETKAQIETLVTQVANLINGSILYIPIGGDADLCVRKLCEHPGIVKRLTPVDECTNGEPTNQER